MRTNLADNSPPRVFVHIHLFVYLNAYPFFLALNLAESLQFASLLVDFMNTMWCQQCQQDVPAVASSGKNLFCCPRCGGVLNSQVQSSINEGAAQSEQPIEAALDKEIPSYDCWEFDDPLCRISHVLQGKADDHRQDKLHRYKSDRFDQSHDLLSSCHAQPKIGRSGRKTKSDRSTAGGFFLGMIVWMVLLLGTAALVCGGVLLGWSILAERNELWKIGLPIAAGGQIAILLGFVLQLDRFWNSNKNTASKLDEVDAELHDLKTTASLLASVHGPSPTAFYSHLAGGANTQLLLSDLKSQLDLLAVKITEQENG